MTEAADLEILRRNSKGDDRFMRDMVRMCIDQADQQIHSLQNLCLDGRNEDWMHAAHALKGTASTLGAENLRQLCEQAQKQMLDATATARREQVANINTQYALVRQSLKNQGF